MNAHHANATDMKCPRCGAELDAAVASGICPACLLKQAALGTGANSIPGTPWTPPPADELASAFPQLEVLELIGHGGMGAVYKARQKSLGRLVALKILAPQHAANPDFAERFAREAKVLAEVSHPNIVTVHDFGRAGQADEIYFLTMEFVDGVNLRQAMSAGRLTPQEALAIVPPICEALQFAHDRGIVHRDIKPENLLLDKEGRVKIADFGIARMLRVGQAFQPDDSMSNASQAGKPDLRSADLTQESVVGTPSYMAPEQRDRPSEVDHRADIFSLGVVLYEMLTGELPGSKLQPPSRKVQIDVRLDEIVLRALDAKPELRFHTATEFREQVESVVMTPTRVIDPTNASSAPVVVPPLAIEALLRMYFQTAWGRRFLQLSHLGFLGFLCFLSFIPGFERTLGFSGLFGFFGLIGFAVMAEHWHRRRGHTAQNPLAAERSRRHKIAMAASVVWLITGVLVGTVQLKATEVRFRYDFSWMALTLFLLSTAVMLGMFVSKSIKAWCEKRDPQSKTSLFGWLRAVSVLGFAMTLPFVMFTTGMLDGLFSQTIVFEAGLALVLLPIGVIGFIALPWASGVLWRARFLLTAASDPQEANVRRQRHRLIVIGTVVAMLIAMWVVISVPARPQTVEVTTRHATVENGHYSFEYSVQTVPGWNVWLTLENAQLIKSDSPRLDDRWPVVVSRYQAKLVGNGRVRVPLEYLPTTNEGLGKMRSSLGPDGERVQLGPRHEFSMLAYQTESLIRVWSILMLLPEGQTPDSLLVNEPTGSPGSPRYKTIEPPAQPKLGPFEGTYEQGRVELLGLSDHPPKGQPHWKPNGEMLTESVPEAGGSSTASGKIMKEVVIRVHSETGKVSWPVLRFPPNSGFAGMGISFHHPDAKQPYATMITTVPCPPEAREMTFEVGVADGEWHKAIEFARHENQPHSSKSESGGPTRGTWAGTVRSASIVGDRVPLAFSYSRRNDCETRMTYERDDGTIVPLIGEGSDGNGDMINSLATLPVEEFKRIKNFRVESRRYQWVEFRNVSLQLGHRTQVEVQNAGLFFPPTSKSLKETVSAQREGEAPAEPRMSFDIDRDSGLAGASPSRTSITKPRNANKIDTTPIIMKLAENEKFVRGFRVKTETKIRQRVGPNFTMPEIQRQIKTSFAIDERGRIRSEQTGGVPGRIGTTDVLQRQEIAVFDGLMLKLLQGPPNEPGNWGYHGRDKYRMPREVDPRNYLLEHANEPLRPQISGGKYEVVGKEMWQEREVIAFESSTTTRESEKTSYRGRLLLDPSLGYAAVYRVSQIRFDDLGPEWHNFARYELSEYKPATGGLFVPGRAIYTSLLPNRDVIKAKQPAKQPEEIAWQHDIRFLDWEINPQFTDADFQLTFPDGIFVMDESQQPPASVPAAKPTDSNSSTKQTGANADRFLFTGQVHDAASKKPVAGAEVIMRYRDNDWQKQEALARADGELIPLLAERRATTDAAGQFSFGIPPECEGRDIAIERSVWHPDFVVDRSFGHWVVTKSKLHDADAARKLFGTIALTSGHVVTGQVVDIDGQPARGVPIHVAWQYPEYMGATPLTRTDAAGRYQVHAPGREEHRIFVLPTHAVPQSLRIKKGFGEQPVVRLEKGVRVRGRVLNAAGNGVRDVVVQGNGDDSVYHGIDKPLVCVRTDAEGRYELPPLPLGTDVRVISEGWTGLWQRRGEKLADVYLPTFAKISDEDPKPAATISPPTEITIDFTPVETVKLTARCFNADNTPGNVNAELYGTSPKSERQRWRGRFAAVADQPGLFELRVPKSLTHAAIDLMHDGNFQFNNATRAAPTEAEPTRRIEVRYEIINANDDTIEIRATK